jgi:Dolichyl-phosphate-mannose-protein mannosyltransferase
MRNYVLLAAIVLAGIIPFSSRAVYLDEHIFLHVAQSVRTNWFFPQDTSWVFFGTRTANLAAHTHPPVGEYYLALLYSLFGEFREVPFRIAFSVFPIAAVLGFYNLARRFTPNPFLVALMFAANAAFYVYSSTLMMDIPMLAFLLVGFALYFGHVQGRRGFLALAAVCFILAVGTGYTALVPLTCLFFVQIIARRPRKEMLAVCAAPAALAVWLTAMTIHFGGFPLVQTVKYYATQGSMLRNTLATLSFLGGITILSALSFGNRRVTAISIPIIALLTLFISWRSFAYQTWFIVLASAGVGILASFVSEARRLIAAGKNHGEAFLLLWVPAALLFFIVVADMVNARYMLLIVAPLYLVIFGNAGESRLILTLIPTVAFSVALAYADFNFVNLNRDLVERAVVPLQRQGFRVWSAAESGLRFYLEQKGIVTLATPDVTPGPGDLIVQNKGHFAYSLAEPIAVKLTVLKTFTLSGAFPLRLYSRPAGAGFHDSGAGLVPFTFSRVPYDSVEVAQVSPLVSAVVWSPDGPIFIQNEPEREFPLKMPSDTKIEYDLEGDGVVALYSDRVLLKKGASSTVWRNFRIVPKHWGIQ